jgi:hypothetical protein
MIRGRTWLSFFRQEDLIKNPARLCEAPWFAHGLRAIDRNRTVLTRSAAPAAGSVVASAPR